jgi:hypothetical protein
MGLILLIRVMSSNILDQGSQEPLLCLIDVCQFCTDYSYYCNVLPSNTVLSQM